MPSNGVHKRAGQNLPTSYYQGMDTFIQAYKKEHKNAKKEGRTVEQEADLKVV